LGARRTGRYTLDYECSRTRFSLHSDNDNSRTSTSRRTTTIRVQHHSSSSFLSEFHNYHWVFPPLHLHARNCYLCSSHTAPRLRFRFSSVFEAVAHMRPSHMRRSEVRICTRPCVSLCRMRLRAMAGDTDYEAVIGGLISMRGIRRRGLRGRVRRCSSLHHNRNHSP